MFIFAANMIKKMYVFWKWALLRLRQAEIYFKSLNYHKFITRFYEPYLNVYVMVTPVLLSGKIKNGGIKLFLLLFISLLS